MPLDGMFCGYLARELDAALAGCRVEKIHHPAKDDLVFTLRGQRLLFCLQPQRARAGLITQPIENPAQPSMFCMLLRKRLLGAKLAAVAQEGRDRVLYFYFSGTDDVGDPAEHLLIAEFLGRRANLILTQGGKVIEALRRAEPTGQRPIWPGAAYAPPPQNENTTGLSPVAAKELALRPNAPVGPYLLRGAAGEPEQFSFIPLAHLGRCERMESYSALLELFYGASDKAQRLRQSAAALRQVLSARTGRLRRKLAAQREELARAENRETLRLHAELILANKARLEKEARGSDAYLLENYYDGNQLISIPADPALGPAANAQKRFKAYQKAKTAAGLLGEFIAQGEAELEYLESVEELLCRAEAPEDIGALRAEMEAQGYLKPKGGAGRKKPPPLPPLEYCSGEGLRILVGRSNLQNDQLSQKTAKPGDLWFHAKDCPGAHVILCCEGRAPGEQSVYEAAALAAWHSRARGAAAEVVYTPARELKKPRGAPPGKVIYHTCKSIMIKGDFHGRD
ncbi:MAG: NFACT family protein [Oscillospiraceae bacterium]|jgi:predicted ribosome quality control (RQC) complex YloA/Tae2 family protein|nr:NFACT family protein [Oscillospiraceae bacterium]